MSRFNKRKKNTVATRENVRTLTSPGVSHLTNESCAIMLHQLVHAAALSAQAVTLRIPYPEDSQAAMRLDTMI